MLFLAPAIPRPLPRGCAHLPLAPPLRLRS
ncbi:unnamed protein product [Spirodela intermedia]|uniref:Uncharacterized protein n=1 Tax=Spirodela intermedia TaxID=51605 RepID=A0A7I8K0W2_SPIIN|nr:unnamed protein product [Spirodela intermedia]